MQQTVVVVSLPITAGLLALGMAHLVLLQYMISLVLCLLAWGMAARTAGDRAAQDEGLAPHLRHARTRKDTGDDKTPLRLAA